MHYIPKEGLMITTKLACYQFSKTAICKCFNVMFNWKFQKILAKVSHKAGFGKPKGLITKNSKK